MLLDFSGLRALWCVVGVAGAQPALVCGMTPAGEVVSVGWGVTLPVGIMA